MTRISYSDTVLITGSSGRLGRLIRSFWRAELGAGPTPVYLSRAPEADDTLCLNDQAQRLPQVKTIIALWGATSGTEAELAVNAQLAVEARNLAFSVGADRVFHVSSAAIYGPGKRLSETATAAPGGPYGQAKLDMERTVQGFKGDGIAHCCLRLANVVGADSLAPALASGTTATIDRFDDGRGPRRSYISPGDLVRVLQALIALPADRLPGVLNVAAPLPVGMDELAQAAGLRVLWRPAPHEAVAEVSLDTTRLHNLLPHVILATSARDMVADWKRAA